MCQLIIRDIEQFKEQREAYLNTGGSSGSKPFYSFAQINLHGDIGLRQIQT